MMILQTPIRRDAKGRYCLNDLHKAAGEQKRHEPNRFLRLEATTELVHQVSNSPHLGNKNPADISKGRYGGSYVHKLIALDYAAWVSPSFKLEVYRGFKESRSTQPTDTGLAIMPAGLEGILIVP